MLIAAGAIAFWIATAPRAPDVLAEWWDAVENVIATGEWPDGLAPVSLSTPGGDSGDEALTGRATIVDADTLEIRGTRIRLHAIDAPESAQPCFVGGSAIRCGQRAANALDGWIAERTVSCRGRDIDQYGRTVATCTVGGEDVGSWLVRNGHAVAYRRYGDDYVCDEAAAAEARRGLWAMRFVEPSSWRRMSDDERRRIPSEGYDPGWPFWCG